MDSASISFEKKITKVENSKRLLKPTLLHRIITVLFELLNHVHTISPPFFIIALISKIYLLLSIATFSYLPQSSSLFPSTTLTNSIINTISSFFLLSYTETSERNLLIIAYVFIAIFVFFVAFIAISALIFQSKSKVPQPVLSILSLIIIIGPLHFHFLVLSLSHLSRIMIYSQTEHFSLTLATIIILALIILVHYPFYYGFLSPTIYFRPRTILFYSSEIEAIFYLVIHLFTFFSVTFSHGEKLLFVILTYISLIFLVILILFYFFDYDIILTSQFYSELPVFVLSFILLAIVNTIRLRNSIRDAPPITIPSYFLFLFLALYLVLILIIYILMQLIKDKFLQKLDHIEEIELKSETQFFRLLRFAMYANHPHYMDWTLFNLIQDKMTSKRYATCYVKFLSYYFDKENELKALSLSLPTMWENIYGMKNLKYQIFSLLQTRELSLTPHLQKKINKLNNQCIRCRSLMRYMWENVIRNDLSNIDRLSFQLYSQIQKIQQKYDEMLLSYKHNHYLLKSYSHFLSDTVHKPNEGQYWNRIQKKLRSGERVGREKTQIVSKSLMRNSLQDPDYYIKYKTNVESIDSIYKKMEMLSKGIAIEEDEELSTNETIKVDDNDNENAFDDKKQQRQLDAIISNVRLPSMKAIVPSVFFVFSILIPALILFPFMQLYSHADVDRTAFLSITQSGGLAPSFIQMLITTMYCTVNANGFMVPLVDNFKSLNISMEYWPFGWTNETTNGEIFIEFLEELRNRISGFNSLISDVSLQKYYYNSIVSPFYADDYDFQLYDVEPDPYAYIPKFTILMEKSALSMETILALYMSFSYRINGYEGNCRWMYAFEQDFRNIELNSDVILSNLEKYTATIMELALQDRKRQSTNMTFLLLGCTLLIIIISIVTWVVVSYFFNRDSTKVYSILQFVPKSEISLVMHNLLPKENDENADDKQQAIRNKALKILITPVRGFKKDWFSAVRIILSLALFVIVFVNLGVQIYLKNHFVDRPFNSAPMIYHCGRMHTKVGTIIHKMIVVSILWMTSADTNVTKLKEDIAQATFEALPALNEFRFGNDEGSNYNGINTVDSVFANRFSQDLCDLPIDSLSRTNLFICHNFETTLSWILTAVRKTMDYEPAAEYDDTTLNIFIFWVYRNSYEMFVLPTEDYLMQMFDEYIMSYKKATLISTLIFIVTLFFIGLILTVLTSKMAEPVYNCLRLLLFVNPNIVFQSKPIIKLLVNGFSSSALSKSFQSSSSSAKSDKYSNFIGCLNDAVIITSNDGKIAGINKAAVKLLTDPNKVQYFQDNIVQKHVESESVENPSFFDILQKLNFGQKLIKNNEFDTYLQNLDESSKRDNYSSSSVDLSDNNNLIDKNIVDVINNKKFTSIFNVSQNQRLIPQFDLPLNSDDSIHLKSLAFLHTGEIATSEVVSSSCVAFYCFVIRDKIENAAFRRLLNEETKKCKQLIASFFPAPLVNLIKEGQSNRVELTVPSAPILFIQIPNLASVSSDYKTSLQILAKFGDEVNSLLEKYRSLTLIKMHGSCLMIAGGIFDMSETPNQKLESKIKPQPSAHDNVHIKSSSSTLRSINHSIDSVSFAIDIIHSIRHISNEMQIELICTAGIHICSSLSVGVVGDERPSLEAVGHGIYTAQIINDTAQSNTVHITEAVYNTVFSAGFIIKEDKDVTIGEKKLKTFCVVDFAEN